MAPIPNIAVVRRAQIRIDHAYAEAIHAAKKSDFGGVAFGTCGLEAL